MDAEALFDHLWRRYVEITPQAPRIHALLRARGEQIHNDHIALRTFALPEVGLERLALPFLDLGYRVTGAYEFPAKHLLARSYSHPAGGLPRVFISELLVDELGAELGDFLRALSAEATGRDGTSLLLGAPAWATVSFEDYERLAARSSYAAWLAAFGIRANHFTVFVNDLRSFEGVEQLNEFLREEGFSLNGDEGGRSIQGGPGTLLEQSSTLASKVSWVFAGGRSEEIPGCYYEFARRYVDPRSGALFDGFVTRSADRIFESTDRGQPD